MEPREASEPTPGSSKESPTTVGSVNSAVPSPRARSKTYGRACVHCHQRKVRCDIIQKGSPCTNCDSHKRSGCRVYDKKKERRTSKPAQASAPVAIRPRPSYNGVENVNTATKRRTRSHAVPRQNAASSSSSTSKRQRGGRHSSDSSESSDERTDPGNLCELIDNQELRASQIGWGARMCFIGTDISNFNYLVRQSTVHPSHDTVFHFANRQFSRKQTAHDLKHIPPEALERPDENLAAELIEAYFAHVNRGWPIIDEAHFMHQYQGRNPRDPVALSVMNAIFLAGGHVLSPTRSDVRAMLPTFFRRAKTLMDYRFEQDRMAYIQTALLMTWYSDGLEEVVANAWHWIGMATRTAFGLGMHIDPSGSGMLPVHKRTWRRLWWVLFQFDTIVSASYGRPQAIRLEESDVPELTHDDFHGMPRVHADFVIEHTRLCMVISETIRARWALRSTPESRAEATRKGDEALARFFTQLPSSLQLNMAKIDGWQVTLHLTYNNFLILLHRPPPRRDTLAQDADEANAHTNFAICGDAAAAITSAVEAFLAQQGDKAMSDMWLYSCHALFTVMTHVGSEMGSANPLVAARSRRTYESLLSSLRAFSEHWKFAHSLFCLFEGRDQRHRMAAQRLAVENQKPHAPAARGEDGGFSLRPAPLQPQQQHQTDELVGDTVQSTFAPELSLDTSLAGSTGPDTPYSMGGFMGTQALVGPDGMFTSDFPFPEASALDFFLASMEGSGPKFGFEGGY